MNRMSGPRSETKKHFQVSAVSKVYELDLNFCGFLYQSYVQRHDSLNKTS